ncbi:rod shape determining protein RodA [Ruminococcaceae bacterium YRB3002]|nr:rod shape determining protein RodA [Ruminococcaceae bacterium YRB3002]
METRKSGIVRLRNNEYNKRIDYYLIVPVFLLTVIGLYVLQRVLSSGYAAYPGNYYRQIYATMAGMFIATVIAILDTHFLKLVGRLLYGAGLFLLILVPIDGYSLKSTWGADSWLNLPVIGNFQPSELMKIGLVMVAAEIFELMAEKKINYLRGLLYLAAAYGPPMLLIFLQPDFGTAMVIVFSFACMAFVWGVKYRYLLLAISSTVVIVAPSLWFFYMEDYQKARILSHIFSGSDPQAEYNLVQAKAAIASGGLTGNHTGVLTSVPVKESDFIYTAVSEHLGFIGTAAVVILAFFFLARCMYVANNAQLPSQSYIVMGLTASFAFHFIENLGMSVGLLPITGIPLPFISLGGTAMLINFIAFGLILNISMDRK